MNEEVEDKEYVEAVQTLLHYAIRGKMAERFREEDIPTLIEVNQITQEVLKLGIVVGIVEEGE